MSNQIIMTSSYAVINEDIFKASLVHALGSEKHLQTSIQKQLNEIAETAEKSKLNDGVISIESVIKPKSGDSSSSITITDEKDVTTLTIPQSVSMELEVTVIDTVSAEDNESGVAMSVSTTKNYPLEGDTETGIAQVVTALCLFDEGKLFDAKLTSATLKNSSPTDDKSSS